MRASIVLAVALGVLSSSVTGKPCACKKVSNPGLYCGYCSQVTALGDGGSVWDVYWCNTSGGCDDLGWSSKCTERPTHTYCDGRDKWKRDAKAENVKESEQKREEAFEE